MPGSGLHSCVTTTSTIVMRMESPNSNCEPPKNLGGSCRSKSCWLRRQDDWSVSAQLCFSSLWSPSLTKQFVLGCMYQEVAISRLIRPIIAPHIRLPFQSYFSQFNGFMDQHRLENFLVLVVTITMGFIFWIQYSYAQTFVRITPNLGP